MRGVAGNGEGKAEGAFSEPATSLEGRKTTTLSLEVLTAKHEQYFDKIFMILNVKQAIVSFIKFYGTCC